MCIRDRILMMNLACAMAQKSGTTGPLSWNYNETSKELTDCSLANMKAGDIFYDRGNYINALENYQTCLLYTSRCV